MTNKEKIKKLEFLLENVIIQDGPEYIRNKSQIDIFKKIDTIVRLQETISNLRRIQNLKDKNLYKGEVD